MRRHKRAAHGLARSLIHEADLASYSSNIPRCSVSEAKQARYRCVIYGRPTVTNRQHCTRYIVHSKAPGLKHATLHNAYFFVLKAPGQTKIPDCRFKIPRLQECRTTSFITHLVFKIPRLREHQL